MVVDHPQDQINGEISEPVGTRSSLRKESPQSALISKFKPKNINEDIVDESWLE